MSSKFFTSKIDNKVNTKGKSKANNQSKAVKTNSVKKAGRGK
jgi:hypothetical protein|tara:strand:- start:66 stop:191 length:126 start_codon:yes stop_codon:yes gene_type:complete